MNSGWLGRLWSMLRERRGAVGPIMTLMLVPLVGVLGVAAESSGWFFMQRAAQNAADAAVMAAASNGCDPLASCAQSPSLSPTYIQEARTVAAGYGFADGENNTTVAATDTAACPASESSNCYKVTVTKLVPIALVTVVGYKGDATINGVPAVSIAATAIASAPVPATYCTVTLANGLSSTTAAFTIKGGSKTNFNGCDVYSNASASCNGQGQPTIGVMTTVGTGATGCGASQITGASKYVDATYAPLAKNIPKNNCSSYKGATLTANLAGNGAGSPLVVCGNLTVPAAGVNLTTAPGGSVIIIENGNLVLSGNLTATFGSPLTIIFSNTAGGSPGFVTGNGVLDFGAPTAGTWQGVALYQDPGAKTQTSYTYAGNSPTFNITGLVYAPYLNLTFKGAVNKETNGYSCMAFIVNTLQANGTGYIFSSNPDAQCQQAGVVLPSVPNTVVTRQALVQ